MNLDTLYDLIASNEAFRAALSVDPVAALKSVGYEAGTHLAEEVAKAVGSIAQFQSKAC